MSFKTIDGVVVYDKADVDGIIEPLIENVGTLDTQITEKADKSEVAALVDQEVEAVIETKIGEIAADIEAVVQRDIGTALTDYYTKEQVDEQIAAVEPATMTTAEATAIVDTYF